MDWRKEMSWSYRVVKTVTKIPLGNIDISYGIHEIFYDENNDVVSISEKAYAISDDIEGLKWNLQKMVECCDKPILDYHTGEEIGEKK